MVLGRGPGKGRRTSKALRMNKSCLNMFIIFHINMSKYFNNTLLSFNLKRMKHMHFCPKRPVFSKFSQIKVLFLLLANV